MKNWMTELAAHYKAMRARYPTDQLLLLFDIDGTILDMRYLVRYVLQSYDRMFNTRYFQALTVNDITVHENQVMPLLSALNIKHADLHQILAWYEANAWSSAAILQAHRPFSGVLEVLRWFQMQPNTHIGLNTGRSEFIRADTLRSLNQLGQEYKVQFTDKMLYMRASNQAPVAEAKVEGARYFQQAGYRIVAFIDNEPENLQAIAEFDASHEILLLHADTIFQTKRAKLPKRAISGQIYKFTDLISESALPRHIQFVWRGIHNDANLAQFLASDVHWGEFDVRLNPTNGQLIIRPDSFSQTALQKDETWLTLDYTLDRLRYRQKGIKLDLKAGGHMIDRVLKLVTTYGFNSLNLWFNGQVEYLQEPGFHQLATAHPGAIIECPVDFLVPLICDEPARAKTILNRYRSWGINRFSISWQTPNLRRFFDQMDEWGFEVNIYNVPDLETFLQAILLLPHSITSNFNFPAWSYYGAGTGENGHQPQETLEQYVA